MRKGVGHAMVSSDPLDLVKWSQRELLNFTTFNRIVDTKTSIIQTEPNK